MNGKDHFILGSKLFGVYCIILAVPALLQIVPGIAMARQSFSGMGGGMTMMFALGYIWPLVYLAGGLYLIRDGEAFYKFAYPGAGGGPGGAEDKFLLYLKMLGIYLVVTYFGDVLKVLAGIAFVLTAPESVRQSASTQGFLGNLAASLWGTLAGLYLVKSGRYAAKLAARSLSPVK
ncbi:MAG TPA: hypothetical protein PKI19_07875 [Elusimicrobiales bacterium]|nr:hypothetical protein [Elusimicrobiales bacterium]